LDKVGVVLLLKFHFDKAIMLEVVAVALPEFFLVQAFLALNFHLSLQVMQDFVIEFHSDLKELLPVTFFVSSIADEMVMVLH
jgi:hypothetical protein